MDDTTPEQAGADGAAPENLAIAVPYDDFVAGLPIGRFRLIVNPDRAYKYVRHRMFLNGISIPLLGTGVALALVGYMWPGVIICLFAWGLRRFVKHQAPKILLHLAQKDAKVYYETIEYEIMEVRLAQD
ncbi:MAG TPA: hypothetical protein VNZ68_07895 [Rhodocyclaceae bacterium]|nr:hypothetical protein [Rhodocyclaceae bacterium]